MTMQQHPEPKAYPMDALDLIFMVFAAIVPVVGVPLAFLQWWARRSPAVVGLLLDSTGVPLIGEGSSVTHALFPGAAKLLPEPTEAAHIEMPARETNTGRATGLLSLAQWRDALNQSPHLLIYGPSNAGKSTLAQAYVATLGACAYVIIDPLPNKPNERKWGGVDFITLDEDGDDEFASIKAALQRIKDEDNRRRKVARHELLAPLVVIIDEVLLLVDALGTTTNAEGKKEPLMSHFIRTMSHSARHRNIKLLLIGQGKNLADLGLSSSTARNNCALVRVTRNAATNQRAAFIETLDGEQRMDIRSVPQLAAAVNQRARVWLSQRDVAPQTSAADDDLLSSLLASTAGNEGGNERCYFGNESNEGVTASECDVTSRNDVTVTNVTAQEAAKIALLLASLPPSEVAKRLDGYTPKKYAEYKSKVEAVQTMLG